MQDEPTPTARKHGLASDQLTLAQGENGFPLSTKERDEDYDTAQTVKTPSQAPKARGGTNHCPDTELPYIA